MRDEQANRLQQFLQEGLEQSCEAKIKCRRAAKASHDGSGAGEVGAGFGEFDDSSQSSRSQDVPPAGLIHQHQFSPLSASEMQRKCKGLPRSFANPVFLFQSESL